MSMLWLHLQIENLKKNTFFTKYFSDASDSRTRRDLSIDSQSECRNSHREFSAIAHVCSGGKAENHDILTFYEGKQNKQQSSATIKGVN